MDQKEGRGTMIWSLFLGGVKIILLGMLALYITHVVLTLRTEGTDYQPRFDPHDPARSAERLLVWLGVQILSVTMAGLKAALDILEDTSADLGEWVMHRRNS
jgi:hypothetical protein